MKHSSHSFSEFVPECVECRKEFRAGRKVQCSVCDQVMHRECAPRTNNRYNKLSDYRCSRCLSSSKSTSPSVDTVEESPIEEQLYVSTYFVINYIHLFADIRRHQVVD